MIGTESFAKMLDVLVNGRPAEPEREVVEKPILDIKAFMLALMRQYSGLADQDGLRWQKAFRNKETGKQYRVSVSLCEIEPVKQEEE